MFKHNIESFAMFIIILGLVSRVKTFFGFILNNIQIVSTGLAIVYKLKEACFYQFVYYRDKKNATIDFELSCKIHCCAPILIASTVYATEALRRVIDHYRKLSSNLTPSHLTHHTTTIRACWG